MKRKVIAIPDLHFPFVHKDCLTWIIEDVIKYEKPDIIIQLGDLEDQFSFSRFARTNNLMTPKEELDSALALSGVMWERVRKAAPDAMRVQILGNHDIRISKRVMDELPELETLIMDGLAQRYQFKGVKTVMDPKQEVEIDGVIYTHGHYTKLGDHMKYFHQSCVHGHSHRGGVMAQRIRETTLFELDAGFCSDETAVPLRYGATRRSHWTLGCGKVDKYGGHFLLYPHQPIKTSKVF